MRSIYGGMRIDNQSDVGFVALNSIGKKIRQVREVECLTRKQFAELTGVPETAQKNYERGITKNIGVDAVMKITNHPRFEKYTLWLMTGKTSGVSEQVCPDIRGVRRIDDQ